ASGQGWPAARTVARRRSSGTDRGRLAPPQATHRDRRGGDDHWTAGRATQCARSRHAREAPAMKAVCWQGIGQVGVEDVPDPYILNPRDAIVKVTATAICGSDLHLYDGYVP